MGAGLGAAGLEAQDGPDQQPRPGCYRAGDLRELLERYRAHSDCRLRWIAGHAGHRWNEYADSLATAWMRDAL